MPKQKKKTRGLAGKAAMTPSAGESLSRSQQQGAHPAATAAAEPSQPSNAPATVALSASAFLARTAASKQQAAEAVAERARLAAERAAREQRWADDDDVDAVAAGLLASGSSDDTSSEEEEEDDAAADAVDDEEGPSTSKATGRAAVATAQAPAVSPSDVLNGALLAGEQPPSTLMLGDLRVAHGSGHAAERH